MTEIANIIVPARLINALALNDIRSQIPEIVGGLNMGSSIAEDSGAPLRINPFSASEMIIAVTIPRPYKPIKVRPCELNIPK